MQLTYRGVNQAFYGLTSIFASSPVNKLYPLARRESRNGPVLMLTEPVLLTYTHPRERVLLSASRDANPFFHLYEVMWMLAGRNDVVPLAFYNSRIENYSDDGEVFNGAYGRRWRQARTAGEVVRTYSDVRDGGGLTGPGTQANLVVQRANVDQLKIVIDHLKAEPDSRRAVLQMWNVEDDLLKIGEGNCTCHPENNNGSHFLGCGVNDVSKDVCCNLSVMFSLREAARVGRITFADYSRLELAEPMPDLPRVPLRDEKVERDMPKYALDMTVTNRSNDMVWGLVGANFVHFSFLQEYVANCLGVELGTYHHFTNNLHVYLKKFEPERWLSPGEQTFLYPSLTGALPLVHDQVTFDSEVQRLVENNQGKSRLWRLRYVEPFLDQVVQPALDVYYVYRVEESPEAALRECEKIQQPDWRRACREWVERRANKKEVTRVAGE